MIGVEEYRKSIENLTLASLASLKGSRRIYSGNKFGDLFANIVSLLPAVPMNFLQDLNPSSPTYGEFYQMAGYDPVGTHPLGG